MTNHINPHLNYLLIDKDYTLGNFVIGEWIYPNVSQFLQQHNAKRKIVIVTNATTAGAKQHLLPIEQYIHHYIGRENFQEKRNFQYQKFYITTENLIKEVEADYHPRSETLPMKEKIRLEQEEREQMILAFDETDPEKQTQYRNKMIEISEFLNQLLHKQTHQPFDQSTLYKNPYHPELMRKDLHLVRRYLNPQNYQHLRNIMIGDSEDGISTPRTDPFTPVIIINNQQREGNWQPISNLIDILYHKPLLAPWQVFNEIYEQGTSEIVKRYLLDYKPQEIRTTRFNNQTYELDTANNGRRIVLRL